MREERRREDRIPLIMKWSFIYREKIHVLIRLG